MAGSWLQAVFNLYAKSICIAQFIAIAMIWRNICDARAGRPKRQPRVERPRSAPPGASAPDVPLSGLSRRSTTLAARSTSGTAAAPPSAGAESTPPAADAAPRGSLLKKAPRKQ